VIDGMKIEVIIKTINDSGALSLWMAYSDWDTEHPGKVHFTTTMERGSRIRLSLGVLP